MGSSIKILGLSTKLGFHWLMDFPQKPLIGQNENQSKERKRSYLCSQARTRKFSMAGKIHVSFGSRDSHSRIL